MKIAVNIKRTHRGWTSPIIESYAIIERDHVPQIGTTLHCAAITSTYADSTGKSEVTTIRRALVGNVNGVHEIDDPCAPSDRPTVTIVVEEIVA